jgi:hypothetical protein
MGHRERLLEAAPGLPARTRYANTTARDLVRESGTNSARSATTSAARRPLLHEAVAQGMEEWTEEVEREASSTATSRSRTSCGRSLRAMVDRFEELRPFLVAFVEAYPPATRDERPARVARRRLRAVPRREREHVCSDRWRPTCRRSSAGCWHR